MATTSQQPTDPHKHEPVLRFAAEQGIALTVHEENRARQQVEKLIRQRQESRRPDPAHYATDDGGRATRFIAAVLNYSRAAVPIIALLAALASSVRTVQTASEIYTASGSHPIGVAIAAIGFTIGAEFALFALALAQENENLKRKRSHQRRHVASLAGVAKGIRVRIGVVEPLRYDELPERDGLGIVMGIALVFTIASNAYIGLRPLLNEVGASSLQTFFAGLWNAPAHLQLTFVVDTVAVLFPPLMALAAGHLTARFAADVSQTATDGEMQFRQDLADWRTTMNDDPLATEEGQTLLQEALQKRLIQKAAKQYQQAVKPEQADSPFGSRAGQPILTPVMSSNGSHAPRT
jgi:hypothetical protein